MVTITASEATWPRLAAPILLPNLTWPSAVEGVSVAPSLTLGRGLAGVCEEIEEVQACWAADGKCADVEPRGGTSAIVESH